MTSKTYTIPSNNEIHIQEIRIGDKNPLVIQSMANTDTNDIKASVAQSLRIADAGAQLLRFTTQGMREVESLAEISSSLRKLDCHIPLVADVHFRAGVAIKAAEFCEKVRINPGNFTEKDGEKADYSESDFAAGIEKNKLKLIELIQVSKKHRSAIRIGVNHGSLSKRMMSRYGDTPEGMVESALEFLRVCKEADFQNVVVSLKSSNTRVMVHAVRLLVHKMIVEDLYFPLHLGVTESGNGLEGRIKSVVGVATLLQEGIGDTIRISLTEAPENELPVADMIRTLFPKPESLPYHPFLNLPWNPFAYDKKLKAEILGIGGKNKPVVFAPRGVYQEPFPDFLFENESPGIVMNPDRPFHSSSATDCEASDCFSFISLDDEPAALAKETDRVFILDAGKLPFVDIKHWIIRYSESGGINPIILRKKYELNDEQGYVLKASGEFGLLLIDALLEGIWLENPSFDNQFNNWLSFKILQASRNRITSTEFIACPSCGRTRFEIEKVLVEVQEKTSHLTGLKIAVMGCIVNGPGEMADADYGYVGSGQNLVTLYKQKEALLKSVPAENAVDKLIELIKSEGDWKDP